MKKIAVIGSGVVGEALAAGFLAHGYEVTRGSRDASKLADWAAGAGGQAHAATMSEAAAWGDAVVLAVKGTAAEAAVDLCGADALAGKLVMDATNPIADEPPEDGVLRYFTGPNESLMERLQARVPAGRFVKVFSCVGSAFMVDPDFDADQAHHVHLRRRRRGQVRGEGHPGAVRLGVRGHGGREGRAGHRAAGHALVHPRDAREPLEPRVPSAEELTG